MSFLFFLCVWSRLDKCFSAYVSDNGEEVNIVAVVAEQRDEADMVDFVRNTPAEFREYYIQMQAAKRSQAPLPSQVSRFGLRPTHRFYS